MARSEEERIRHAKLDGSARALRGAVWQAPEDTTARHREELPAVWERIDAVIDLLGDPFRPAPPLFRARDEPAAPPG